MQQTKEAALAQPRQATCQSCQLLASKEHQASSPHIWEVPVPDPAAASIVVGAVARAPPCSSSLAEAAEALALHLTCSHCGANLSRKVQQAFCGQQAIPVVAQSLRASLSTSLPHAPQPWLAPLLWALSQLVDGVPTASLACLLDDGWPIMRAALARCPHSARTHAHVCNILAALFPAWVAPALQAGRGRGAAQPLPTAQHAEALLLVANLAAASAQHGQLEAARSAAWALVRMASHAASHPSLQDPTLPIAQQQQLWVMLTGQVMLTVMDLLASVAKQDHKLAKHCLSYIEVLSNACLRGGPAAAVAAGGDGSATQFMRDALQLAASVLKQTPELRLQVASLRCMSSLLAHPELQGMLADNDTLATLLRATSLARFTPGANPKDVALMQVYGMCALAQLLTTDNLESLQSTTCMSIVPEVHASVGAVVAYLAEAGKATTLWSNPPAPAWQVEEAAHEVEALNCRLGSMCLSNHEDLHNGALVARMAGACAQVLHWCNVAGAAPLGVNSPDAQGATVLHRLAAAGLLDPVKAFIMAAGSSLDEARKDNHGLTAADVAGLRGHVQVARLLSSAASPVADAHSPHSLASPHSASSMGLSSPSRVAGRSQSLLPGAFSGLAQGTAGPTLQAHPGSRAGMNLQHAAAPTTLQQEGPHATGKDQRAGQPWPWGTQDHTHGGTGTHAPPAHGHRASSAPETAQAGAGPPGPTSASPLAGSVEHHANSDLGAHSNNLDALLGPNWRAEAGKPAAHPISPNSSAPGLNAMSRAMSSALPSSLAPGDKADPMPAITPQASSRSTGNTPAMSNLNSSNNNNALAPYNPTADSSAAAAAAATAAELEEAAGLNMANNGFRVNTAVLSQLILDSMMQQQGQMGLAGGAAMPSWLSAGVAAAVSAHEEAVASAARGGAGSHHLRAEDLALIADAESLLNSQQMRGGPGSVATAGPAPGGDAAAGSESSSGNGKQASKHLWLGNLSTKLPRSVLKAVFEHFGVVEDVVTFPGRMYAFVNFRNAEDAIRAAAALNDREVPPLTGNRRLVVKFRPSKKALGKSAEGPGADAAAAAAAAASHTQGQTNGDPSDSSLSGAAPAGSTTTATATVDKSAGDASSEAAAATSGDASSQEGQKEGTPGPQDHKSCDSEAMGLSSSTGDASQSSGSPAPSCSGKDQEGSEAPVRTQQGAQQQGQQQVEEKPSRHLWLGNVPLRPNKQAMELLFGQYGALESVRVFPGKTYAFVNYVDVANAVEAKTKLDGQPAPEVTGSKPLAVRFQKESGSSAYGSQANLLSNSHHTSCQDVTNATPPLMEGSTSLQRHLSSSSITTTSSTASPPGGAGPVGPGSPTCAAAAAAATHACLAKGRSAVVAAPGSTTSEPLGSRDREREREVGVEGLREPTKAVSDLVGLAAATGLSKLLDDDLPPQPAINLSNRLNPNNIHFDKELAARYKRMTKAEKEALWAQDRLMQQMASSSAAAALLGVTAGLGGPADAALLANSSLGLAANTKQLAGYGAGTLSAAAAAGLGADALAADLHRSLSLGQLLQHVGSNTPTSLGAATTTAQQLQALAAASNLARAGAGGGAGAGHVHSQLLGSSHNHAAAALLQQALQAQQAQQALSLLSSSSNSSAVQAAIAQEQQKQVLLALAGGAHANAASLQAAAQLLSQANVAGSVQDSMQLQGLDVAAVLRSQQAMSGNTTSVLGGAQNGHHAYLHQGAQVHSVQHQQQQQQRQLMQEHALLSSLDGMSSPGYLHSQLQLQQQLQQLLPSARPQAQQQVGAAAKIAPTFVCPLSGVLMLDPVVAADGVTYERSAIAQWLLQHSTSPITRAPLANKFLAPNNALKARMAELL